MSFLTDPLGSINVSLSDLKDILSDPSKALATKKPSSIDPLTGWLTNAIASTPAGRTIGTGVAGYFGGPWAAAAAQGGLSKEAGINDGTALMNAAQAYGLTSAAGRLAKGVSAAPTATPSGAVVESLSPAASDTAFNSALNNSGAAKTGLQSVLAVLKDAASSKGLLLGAGLLSMLSSAPPEAKTAIKNMTPEQQEMFNRPNVSWDWRRMQQDAASSGLSLGQFMSQNWPRLTGYQQNGGAQEGAYNLPEQPRTQPPTELAVGGLAALAQGGGSGRDDTIDARLSDGEYVFDAEAVAMLGDGSNEEGARRLDQMRTNIRAHKGKTLAKGKISPDAKSPLAYLKGVR